MARDQLQVLNALDVAKTQWYHFTAIIIAGMGFFTDAYDLFCISLVTKLLGRIYYHVEGAQKPGTLPPNVAAAVNGVAFCGTLAGQLFFGWLGDKLGRKKVYGMTLMVMVLCSVASGLSFGHEPKTVMATLCFFRFWLGFGIGGDYPLSATIMSEYANKKTRGAFVSAVFAMQGFGIMAGGIFAIIISSAFEAKFPAPAYEDDPLGSTIPQADLFTVAFIDVIGRFAIQMMGFFFMTVFMFALAIPYNHWTHKENRIGFVIMYSLTFFFANFGPNATTFVVPAEIFPARFRSTCHGISAASGKLGAMVGAFGFLYLAQSPDKEKTDAGYPPGIGVRNSLIVLGVVNFLGILFTFLVPESKGKSLEEMSGENEDNENSNSDNRTVPIV
ncbi:PREDICTED: inorganic phosphate transporter 1-4-like [Camelina sativa]|uniref:Inorganic phosphate transporter 1-4-like n=1 Tax=Camelina sativa TaxID=90675 RepID=A0ABM0YXU6_CAMSA|nr:PREDICTED: inorganic phosphate transporter 1-4-like [Camelina sativa]